MDFTSSDHHPNKKRKVANQTALLYWPWCWGVHVCVLCFKRQKSAEKKSFQQHAAKAEIVGADGMVKAGPLPWDFRIMHHESKISVLKYSHTWLKILIISDHFPAFDCLLCRLSSLKQTEQLLYRIRVALLPEGHLSPWEGGFKPVLYLRNLFFVKTTEKGRGKGVFIKCDKCSHKWPWKGRALLSLHLEFLHEGALVTEGTLVGGLLWTPHCTSLYVTDQIFYSI